MMRRLSLVGVVVVLATSGAYALIYLFRWEWHRAIITALFFVAAEIGLAVAVLLRRLARLEERLDALAQQPAPPAHALDPAVLARIQDAAPEPSKPFAWLDPTGQNLSVFLPFLLGVGAIASGLAWVVEHLARRTTTPALERQLALRLAPLGMPPGGLLGPAPVADTGARSARAVPSWAIPLVAVTLTVGVAAAGIDWLGDAIQTRPEARRSDVSTRIELDLRGSRSSARPEQSAAILWGTCSHVLHGSVGAADIRHHGSGHIELIVPADIGPKAEERVRGCLEDAVVDRVQASVVTVESVPGR
jgi:hypothetical protein